MGKLIYVTNLTLDGYIEDESGSFDLFPPNDDVFAAATDVIRSAGTLLYGRRLYETMAVWETEPALAAQSEAYGEFECVLFVLPLIVGGGKPGLPTGTRATLDLLDARRFANGIMLLRNGTLR